MTQTFTSSIDITATPLEKEPKVDLLSIAEPSEATIQNILNYSKNLEVKPSQLLKDVVYVKS